MKMTHIMLAKGFGGAERSFVDSALAMAARGHAVQAICHRDFVEKGRLEGVENLTLETIRDFGEWDFLAPRRIKKLLEKFGSEIVHTQLKRAAWHGSRGAVLAVIPCVSKLHNYVKLDRYQKVHTLICTTEDQRRHVLESAWPAERVVVIPNFSRLEAVAQVREKWPAEPLRLLSYGRCVPKKGFSHLLEAFRQVLDAGHDARLKIGGTGEELENLQKLARYLDLGERIELGVWIDEVADALAEADIFVIPSLDEPFGIVMLEAMARGVPIVSTKTKGPLEVLSEDSAALVKIGSADAIFEGVESLLNDPESTLEKAGRSLQLYREKYHETAVISRIEALYAELTQG